MLSNHQLKKLPSKINTDERKLWENWDNLQKIYKPDPQVLPGILKCLDKRRKLLGLFNQRPLNIRDHLRPIERRS